ncbi:MAG: DegT/DnrJ/EryC1/StrS family aminotransferase, partial [Chloroflexota bacterium]
RAKAIIPVHFGGQPCDMKSIRQIAGKHGLKVIEDAAHALPATYQGETIGTIGDITCFSFYATKTITTGEGGMATTENPEWADRMRMMSLHGISHDAWKRYTREGSWYYEILAPGFKYNLTDVAAALGLVQLKRADSFYRARKRIAELYDAGFAEVAETRTPAVGGDVQHAWHLYVIQLELERLRTGRDEFIEALKNQGIGTSVHFIPLHLHPYYRERFGYGGHDFPVASAAFERLISLPIYPGMTDSQVDRVIEAVRNIAREFRR